MRNLCARECAIGMVANTGATQRRHRRDAVRACAACQRHDASLPPTLHLILMVTGTVLLSKACASVIARGEHPAGWLPPPPAAQPQPQRTPQTLQRV